MSTKQYRAPNGRPIVRVVETVIVTYDIVGIMGDGLPDYGDAPDSTVHWDSAEPYKRDGQYIYEDNTGKEWPFDQLVVVDG